jgi:hypothetical protein
LALLDFPLNLNLPLDLLLAEHLLNVEGVLLVHLHGVVLQIIEVLVGQIKRHALLVILVFVKLLVEQDCRVACQLHALLNQSEPTLLERRDQFVVVTDPLSSLRDFPVHFSQITLDGLVVCIQVVVLDQDATEERKVVRCLEADHPFEYVIRLTRTRTE